MDEAEPAREPPRGAKAELGALLVEHYHKTCELTHKRWEQRNRLFLQLLAVVGAATVLLEKPEAAEAVLAGWLVTLLEIPEGQREGVYESFSFSMVQGVMLLTVFYLMVNLYHRAIDVLRHYAYLGELEREIRTRLGLETPSVAFTREGAFYDSSHRTFILGTVKWAYVLLLGSLLAFFLGGRLAADWREGHEALVFIDAAVSVPVALYFHGYAVHTLRLVADGRKARRASGPGTGDRPA